MKGLLRLVVAVVVAVIAWNLLVPSCSTAFGCAAFGVAHAADDECPSSVDVAATDPEWAAARYETIKDDDLTTGLFYDEDGTEHRFESGNDSDADLAKETLREAGVSDVRVATHVEIKVAARMRDTDVTKGVLIINNPSGPCQPRSWPGCQQVLRQVLAPGATMYLWWPGVDNFKKFVGK